MLLLLKQHIKFTIQIMFGTLVSSIVVLSYFFLTNAMNYIPIRYFGVQIKCALLVCHLLCIYFIANLLLLKATSDTLFTTFIVLGRLTITTSKNPGRAKSTSFQCSAIKSSAPTSEYLFLHDTSHSSF